MAEHYKSKNVKLLKRIDQDTTDLEKSLYVSLEKLSEISCEKDYDGECIRKKYAIIILGASGGRIDHTFSTYSQVYKYLNQYNNELSETDIFMLSKSSFSFYLKPGVINNVITSKTFENREEGYSIIPIFGEGKISIKEDENFYTGII